MEVELLRLVARPLLLLLRTRFFSVQFGFDFLVVLGQDQVMREVVRFLIFDGPGDFLLQHAVHGRDDFGGHVDQSLGQDQTHWRDGILRQQTRQG